MNRNRVSSRLARKQTKNNGRTAYGNGEINQNVSQIDENFDDIDLLFGNSRSKFYPIIPLQKKVNTHNLADIPSLQSDEDSILSGLDSLSQTSETNIGHRRKLYTKVRKNANSLIESKNKFRQLLSQMQSRIKPNFNGNVKLESAFDGYQLKSRKVKYEPRRSRKEVNDQISPSKITNNEFTITLFEKTIDLTSYCKLNPNQYIPLYPICRLWARSNYGMPESLKSKKNLIPPPVNECNDPDGPYSDNPVDVYHLPKPEKMLINENLLEINLRISKKVREFKPVVSPNIIQELNSLSEATSTELLNLNMIRWKEARKEAMEAARQNEKRYQHSLSVIKAMFERSNNQDNNAEIALYKYPPYELDHGEADTPMKQPIEPF